jgi:hypothetical protein
MDGLSEARDRGRVKALSIQVSQCASSPCPTTDRQTARECSSAKRRAACMTRACHSIFKGYLTYTALK